MYFVTICTYHRKNILGKIINDKMQLNKFGKIVENEWLRTQELRNNVSLDEYIVMPNHFHGILIIDNNDVKGTARRAPTTKIMRFGSPDIGTLATIVRSFKSAVTKQINEIRGITGISIWQRNYYEHIIRDEESLNELREYIMYNAMKWQYDCNNLDNIKI
jgi:REP element-mobilizing transposase RayT